MTTTLRQTLLVLVSMSAGAFTTIAILNREPYALIPATAFSICAGLGVYANWREESDLRARLLASGRAAEAVCMADAAYPRRRALIRDIESNGNGRAAL